MAAGTDAMEIQERSMWKNVTILHAMGWNLITRPFEFRTWN
jgi:hypothetical protein